MATALAEADRIVGAGGGGSHLGSGSGSGAHHGGPGPTTSHVPALKKQVKKLMHELSRGDGSSKKLASLQREFERARDKASASVAAEKEVEEQLAVAAAELEHVQEELGDISSAAIASSGAHGDIHKGGLEADGSSDMIREDAMEGQEHLKADEDDDVPSGAAGDVDDADERFSDLLEGGRDAEEWSWTALNQVSGVDILFGPCSRWVLRYLSAHGELL